MATKKITLNELRTLIKQVIKEEINDDTTSIDDIDDAVDDALKLLDPSELKGIDLSEAIITEEEAVLNEAVDPAFVISGLLAAPKLLEWIGAAIKGIAKKFGKNETKIANWIIKKGRKWEKLYLKAIIAAVKFTGFAKGQWKRKDGDIDRQKLVTTAKIIYLVIIVTAASLSVGKILKVHSAVIMALDSLFVGVKVSEILHNIHHITDEMRYS